MAVNLVKEDLKRIFDCAIKAVAPDAALAAHVHVVPGVLEADGHKYDLQRGKVVVAGAGKGAAPMAFALEKLLADELDKGFVVVKYGHELALKRMESAQAGHPVPDAAGEAAAEKLLHLAESCGPDDLFICLFTGGASALLPAPVPGLDLEGLQKTTSALLASGASIDELNAIRKHLSRIGGGRLAKAANGARVLALIVSDVIGDRLDVIASGPTAPDSSTYDQCLEIIRKYKLAGEIPPDALKYLESGAAGEVPETPKYSDALFKNVHNVILASNEQAVGAAARKAGELGFEVIVDQEPMTGEAAVTARELIAKAQKICFSMQKGDPVICMLAGGETTVHIKGDGLGGRNQEMALAASIALEDNLRISALFAGTDGTDGPTDAAGGFASAHGLEKMGGKQKAKEYLANNDSYHALEKADELFVTGPTMTNVMDIAIILIQPPGE